jgi:predicted dehydrogenase
VGNDFRVGIVGLTGIAAAPAPEGPAAFFEGEMAHSHAAGYAAHPHMQVVAVCDLVPELREGFQARWSSRWGEIAAYSDYRAMLAHERLDILSVATSDHLHADVVVDAAAAGVKGIFCEKPIATTLADADRMIEAVERAGAPMVVNHTRRWLPEYHRAREIVCGGQLGALMRIIACLGGPRAMLFRNGTHLVDMINFYAASYPEWVVAELDAGHEDYGPAYNGDGGHDPATDPGATGLIRYRNGIIALLSLSKQTAVRFELDLLCERGRVRLGPGFAEVETPGSGSWPTVQRLAWPQYVRSDTAAAIAELAGLVQNGGQGQCSPREARQALEILLAILRSQHLGNVRVDLPIRDAAPGK